MPALRHPLVATSLPELFLQGNLPPADTHRQMNTATGQATDKCTGYINHQSPADHDGSTDSRQ